MVMADQGGNTLIMRDYRKGNWTMSETMILIEAKKMDDERRMKRTLSGGTTGGGEAVPGRSNVSNSKPAEPRWKWVEDYCWRKGCFRSQNQCNDKWDNLMRDYKKVREHERRISVSVGDGDGDGDTANDQSSYWKLEKNERKDRNLPTNMMPQIYEALMDVVEKKGAQRMQTTPSSTAMTMAAPAPVPPAVPQYVSAPMPLPLPPQPPVVEPHLPLSHQPWQPAVEMRGSSDSETNENSDSSPAKRRRRSAAAAATTASGSASSYEAVGTAISRSASIIAEALQACDQREERRHRDLLNVHERRLKLEESTAETNRQGITGLVDAINKLADSIHALAASSSSSSSSKPNQP